MKKRCFSLIVIMLILSTVMVGCKTTYQRKVEKFIKTLTCDEFSCFMLCHGSFSEDGKFENLQGWDDYDFAILSSDDIVYNTISINVHTDKHCCARPFSSAEDIMYKGEHLWIAVSFDVGTEVEKIPATLKYTTVTGEYVSKDYVLDFTNPYWDAREQSHSA